MNLQDVALVAAHVCSGKGEHGFDDKHRGQLIVLTGPMLAAGKELAEAAKQGLGQNMEFEDVSEYVFTHDFFLHPNLHVKTCFRSSYSHTMLTLFHHSPTNHSSVSL
jgi:hypothetical protein